ncbi:hypothetical protein KIN20_022072 [Parelaphostrongylus tenuis]|uniref:Uncharacterized protein n=1 Tax=Parelaphostrongylus tenuis TaxID=148309 RepID=A0AAD5QV49_PARTN|nr:hypothetical protein KIN20_022072 [Parelaphostrongylus tenuis]
MEATCLPDYSKVTSCHITIFLKKEKQEKIRKEAKGAVIEEKENFGGNAIAELIAKLMHEWRVEENTNEAARKINGASGRLPECDRSSRLFSPALNFAKHLDQVTDC